MWRRIRTVGLWFLTIMLSLSFLPTGFGKFTDPGWQGVFSSWGYPAGFHYLIGALEIIAAVLLLIPRWTTVAAAGLSVLMTGALLTHAVNGNHPTFPAAQMATVYLVVAVLLAWSRWDVSVLRRQHRARQVEEAT